MSTSARVVSDAIHAAGKLTTIIAGRICGADSIDDVNVLRAGGTPRVFETRCVRPQRRRSCCASSPSGIPASTLRLIALAQRTALLAGTDQRMFLDIDIGTPAPRGSGNNVGALIRDGLALPALTLEQGHCRQVRFLNVHQQACQANIPFVEAIAPGVGIVGQRFVA
jgi:hypothetical protein